MPPPPSPVLEQKKQMEQINHQVLTAINIYLQYLLNLKWIVMNI